MKKLLAELLSLPNDELDILYRRAVRDPRNLVAIEMAMRHRHSSTPIMDQYGLWRNPTRCARPTEKRQGGNHQDL